jgi:D-aspartate ligase
MRERRTTPPPSPAVVLQASGPNALGIIRSLARAGVPVIACDHDPHAMGLRSRYARAHLTADPLAEPERFVADLAALGRTLPARGVLFATHDEALSALGPREERLAEWFHRPWSPWPVMSRVLDKAAQHAAARAIGFPVPATVEPRDEGDLAAIALELRFPVVLKPRNAPEFRRRFRRQVLEVSRPEALPAAWAAAAPYGPQASEVIPGGDERIWSLGSYRDAAGRPLASFTGRKLRQWPPRFGTGRVAEAQWDPALAARGHRLLDALGYHGISQLETKRDPRDGRDYLIEVNARSWLWVGLATAVGVNLPYAAYLDAVGRPRALPDGHRGDVRWALLTRHLAASPGEIRRGEWTTAELLRSLRPPLVDGVLDLRDPRPALALHGTYLARLRRRGEPSRGREARRADGTA